MEVEMSIEVKQEEFERQTIYETKLYDNINNKEEKEEEKCIVESVSRGLPEKYQEIYRAYTAKDYQKCLDFIDQVIETHIEYQILRSAW